MEFSQEIINVLNYLCQKFGIAIDWTSENVVPYIEVLCEKLVTYEMCTSVAWIVIMVLFSIGSIVAAKKLYPTFKAGWIKNSKSYTDFGWQFASIWAIILLVGLNLATVIVVCAQAMDIIKCAVFPEMYVFEYIKTLLSAA